MAINKNHEFEELDGIKCGIVEKNVSPSRVDFLKDLLTINGFTVVVVPSPASKVAPPKEGEELTVAVAPDTYTVGVTDYTFNSINAVFGRLLKTSNGHVVTLAYWNQQEAESHDEVPYYERQK
jgi:hypothetical protein